MAGVCFSVVVGFSFYAVKICVPIASTIQILAFRYNFAFLGAIVPVLTRRAVVEIRGKKKKALLWAASLYIGFMILQTIGLIFATSIESAIIFAIIPIIAKIVAAIFLDEHSTWKQNVFACLSVSALIFMIVMSAGDVEANLLGITILFLSSVSMAVSNVIMRYVRKEHKPFTVPFFTAALGAVCFNLAYVAWMLVTEGGLGGYFAPCVNLTFVLATAYLGIPCLVLSSWLMSYMLGYIQAIQATIFGNLSTAISIVAGIVILREPLAFYHAACVLLIITGVIGVSATAKKEGA